MMDRARVRFGLDIDSVLAATDVATCEALSRELGCEIKPGEWRTWLPSQSFPHLAEKGIDEAMFRLFNDPTFALALAPLAGARCGVGKIAYRARVHYITSRPDHLYAVTRQWLRRQGFAPGPLTFTSKPKAGLAADLGLRYFVEDAPHHAQGLAAVCERVFLLDYPYNQEARADNIVRVADWPSLIKLLEEEPWWKLARTA